MAPSPMPGVLGVCGPRGSPMCKMVFKGDFIHVLPHDAKGFPALVPFAEGLDKAMVDYCVKHGKPVLEAVRKQLGDPNVQMILFSDERGLNATFSKPQK